MAKYEYVSLCCGATVTTYEGNHSSNPEAGPADPVDVCDLCGGRCETVDVICANCRHFWDVSKTGRVGYCLGDTKKCIVDGDDETAITCGEFGIETEPQHMGPNHPDSY